MCAPSGNEVTNVLKSLPGKPDILWMTPKSIAEIFENIRDLGQATGRSKQAEKLIEEGRSRLEKIEAATQSLTHRPRVFCIEWIDPVYCSGHWVPEMVRIAGGNDELGREGTDSIRIAWNDVLSWSPEVLIIMPCGFNLDKVVEQAPQLFNYAGWRDLPAVRSGRVFAVDANSYFARPGPRIVDGTELLAHIIHPEVVSWGRALKGLPSFRVFYRHGQSDYRLRFDMILLRPFPQRKEQKNFSVCRAAFSCGPELGQEHCWCDQLPHLNLIRSPDQDCLCPDCLHQAISNSNSPELNVSNADRPASTNETAQVSLVEGDDSYWEGAAMVFTAQYHIRRGYCCESRCRHCPYRECPSLTNKGHFKRRRELTRCVVAEAVGTAMLLAAVVGSGIMGERLAGGNVAIALLANTIATGAALAALIVTFGPISGAHFNPAVTLADASQGGIAWRQVPLYIAAQVAGAFAGVATANVMFGLPVFLRLASSSRRRRATFQ